MNELLYEKALDLDIQKFANNLSNESHLFLINLYESSRTNDYEGFMESSWEDFKEKAIIVIEKALDAIKKFFKDAKIAFDTKVQQFQLNKKMAELKDIMAKKKTKALNGKINYFDMKKYKAYYTDFINRYTAELKKGLNRDFKTVEEYETWRTDMLNKLSDFNFKLSDEEQWKLSVTINSAINLTDDEIKNRERNLKMVEESGSFAIKGLEKYYKTINPEKSFVNYNGVKLKIFSLQNSFIGMVCSKITQAIKTIVKFITKHLFVCITALLIALIAV